MKIMEYPSTATLSGENILLTDGPKGTQKILVTDAILAALHLTSVENHKRIFRGKNLGSTLTSEQKTAIQNGTFEDLWLGDYWVINGVNWRIADFDYWYNVGDTPFNRHHLVIVPETSIGTGVMNGESTTVGGYVGSQMYTTNMAAAKSAIETAFGANLLTHREYLITTMSNGYPSAGEWKDSKIELMNEPMVFGAYINTPAGNGTVVPKRYTSSGTQLALFNVAPKFINQDAAGTRLTYWLRDVVSAERFARVTDYGPGTETAASLEYGIRPIFPIG